MTLLLTVIGTSMALLSGPHGPDWIDLIHWLMAALLAISLPFLLWNPLLLGQRAPRTWWKPAWPGWRAVTLLAALWLVSSASGLAVAWVTASNVPRWLSALFFLLDSCLDIILYLLAVLVWIAHGQRDVIRQSLRRAIGQSLHRLLLWQAGWMGLAGLALAMPMLLLMTLAIFVLPQLDTWFASSGAAIPASIHALADAGDSLPGHRGALAIVSTALGAYPMLIIGRLAWIVGGSEASTHRR